MIIHYYYIYKWTVKKKLLLGIFYTPNTEINGRMSGNSKEYARDFKISNNKKIAIYLFTNCSNDWNNDYLILWLKNTKPVKLH